MIGVRWAPGVSLAGGMATMPPAGDAPGIPDPRPAAPCETGGAGARPSPHTTLAQAGGGP